MSEELYGNTEVVYDNETIASLEPGEATQLDCAGKVMKTVVKVANRSKKVSSTPLEGTVPVYGENGTLPAALVVDGTSYEGAAVPKAYLDEKFTEQADQITKRATGISLYLDTTTYKMKIQLLDDKANILDESDEVDFPLEATFVAAKLNDDGTEIIFTLQNGSTVSVPVSEIAGKFNIVQETGDSTDAVMSQDATTRELEKKVDAPDQSMLGGTLKVLGYSSAGAQQLYVLVSTPGSINTKGRIATYLVAGDGDSIGNANMVLVTGNPSAPYEAANKKYVDDGFVPKPSSDSNTYRMLTYRGDNGTTSVAIFQKNPVANGIPQWGSNKTLKAAGPVENDDCVTLGHLDEQLTFIAGGKYVTKTLSSDGSQAMPIFSLGQKASRYAFINMIGGGYWNKEDGEPYEVLYLQEGEYSWGAVGTVHYGTYIATSNTVTLSGNLEVNSKIEIPLNVPIITGSFPSDKSATFTFRIESGTIDETGDDWSTTPILYLRREDGSYIKNANITLYPVVEDSQMDFTLEIPPDIGNITHIVIEGGSYQAYFGDLKFRVSVMQPQILHLPMAVTKIAIYDYELSTKLREYAIPDEIVNMQDYGIGIDSITYNYIDFDRKVYVHKCDGMGNLETFEIDISAYLTDFDGFVDLDGGEIANISFEIGDNGIGAVPLPYKVTYQGKVQ